LHFYSYSPTPKNQIIMSFALRPYIVKIADVAELFDSKDEASLNSIVQAKKKELQEIRYLAEEEYSPLDALKEIISGQLNPSLNGELYAYVCELLCSSIGEQPKADHWQNLSMNWLMDVNLSAALPIKSLPIPPTFPYVLSLRYQDLEDFVDLMGALDLEEEAWEEFEAWIAGCHQNQKDLILFFY
jgi:hypothetical protein